MFTPRFTCTEYTPTSYYIRWQYKSFMSCSLHFHLLLPFIIKCLVWINLKMFYMGSLLFFFYYEENFVRTEQFARFTSTLKFHTFIKTIYSMIYWFCKDLRPLYSSENASFVYLILNIILIITCIWTSFNLIWTVLP